MFQNISVDVNIVNVTLSEHPCKDISSEVLFQIVLISLMGLHFQRRSMYENICHPLLKIL